MIIKALAIYKLNHTNRKVECEVNPLENPLVPAFTRAHLIIDEQIMFSLTHAKTVQIIDVEVTFECMKCPFKTPSLTEMENHSETHA